MRSPNTMVLRSAISRVAENSPLFWRNLQQLRFHNTNFIGKIVTPHHHVTLEGYPRSANSFALRAFLYANGASRYWAIGSHTHRFPQVSLSVRWNIPTLVVIRHPENSILSLMTFFIQSGRAEDCEPQAFSWLLKSLLRSYARYHWQVSTVANKIVISDFPVTTGHFDTVILELNDRYKTSFNAPEDYDRMQREIFHTGGIHLSPNQHRERMKADFRDMLHRPQNASLLAAAVDAYEACKAHSVSLPKVD